MKPYLMGIDVGTSACKVAVFAGDGRVAASASAGYPVYYPAPGYAEQNPKAWWQAVCRAIGEIFTGGKVHKEDIAGVGIAGQSWSAVAVSRKGEVLTNTPIWMDTRARDICEELQSSAGGDIWFEKSGNPLKPSYTTGKILWYQKHLPQVYRQIDKILQSNSYIVFRLTRAVTQDLSQGYGLHCFDMRAGQWDQDACKTLGINPDFLPDLYACHEVIGSVSSQGAAESGLRAGTPVVAGGLDAACAALGAGVTEPGETQEQGGQAGGMSICLNEYQADSRLILGFHVVPGRWLLQGGTTGGGGVMRWLVQEFGQGSEAEILHSFNELAGAVSAGSDGMVFLPYMAGERSPLWDPAAKGVYYGIDFQKTKGHFIRSAMEGVAFALRHNLEIAAAAGAPAAVLKAMGGSANSRLWTQIKADVTGKEIRVPASDTATTLGAALLAGVGVGYYPDFRQAVSGTIADRQIYYPRAKAAGIYDKNYRVYRQLYEQLKGIMQGKEFA